MIYPGDLVKVQVADVDHFPKLLGIVLAVSRKHNYGNRTTWYRVWIHTVHMGVIIMFFENEVELLQSML